VVAYGQPRRVMQFSLPPHVAHRKPCIALCSGVRLARVLLYAVARDDAERCGTSISSMRPPSSQERQAMCRPYVPPGGRRAKEILCGTRSLHC
jgi:hypothetical protein